MLDRGTESLRTAFAEGWAIGAFSAYNLEQAVAIARAAAAEDVPVILQAGSSSFRYASREGLAALALAVAEGADGRVGVHVDHATEEAEIRWCLEQGYSSVMVDGSSLPFADNVALTRRVVEVAHATGAWVEAELGGLRGDEDHSTGELAGDDEMTDPEEAARFVEATGVDALAVAVGNVHGITATPVVLDLDRLAEIRAATPVPLVLHGASGLPDDDVRAAIALGVAKINVNTELRHAMRAALLEVAADPPASDGLDALLGPLTRGVEDVVRHKIRVFGAGAPAQERLAATTAPEGR